MTRQTLSVAIVFFVATSLSVKKKKNPVLLENLLGEGVIIVHFIRFQPCSFFKLFYVTSGCQTISLHETLLRAEVRWPPEDEPSGKSRAQSAAFFPHGIFLLKGTNWLF